MDKKNITPFLKWAGGKTQLLDLIIENQPKKYNNYYEPFIGGGAVLFGIQPKKAHISDINNQLINIYTQLQSDASKVIDAVKELDAISCDKEYYYKNRSRFNEKILTNPFDVECAALMIWINKHCFNGLYRVNSKGLFNVPYNNRTSGVSANEENLLAIGDYLKSVEIKCEDFEEACNSVKKNDFVYFDSPYLPESETADFTSYTKDGFSMNEHQRLADLFKALDKKGAFVMLSNNDVPLAHSLYEGYNIKSIDVKRFINRDAKNRKGKEVIITNYETTD